MKSREFSQGVELRVDIALGGALPTLEVLDIPRRDAPARPGASHQRDVDPLLRRNRLFQTVRIAAIGRIRHT